MTDWLYDKSGEAQLFLHRDRFINKSGHNLGWLVKNNVYSLDGSHRGWFEDGVLYDGSNDTIAFARNATGRLPSRPGVAGAPGTPGIPGSPGKPGFSGVPGRPGHGGLSSQTLGDFFGITM